MGTAQISAIIPKELKKQLSRYCFENDVKQKAVVVQALENFLQNKPQKEN